MYAEERQQAIARLVTQRGRVSVNQLAREYDVTTETVRRDLSTLERLGLVRRVHGGVVPPGSLSLIESGIRERDRSTPSQGAHRPRRLDRLPPAGGTILLDAGSTTMRLATLLPRTASSRSSPTRCRSPRGSPACATSTCDSCPAASALPPRRPSAPTPSRRCRRPARRRRLPRHQRHHRRPRPDHPRPRRGRGQARDRRRARHVVGARRRLEVRHRDRRPVRRSRRRSTSSSPTTAIPSPTVAPSTKAGIEVVVA